MKTKKEFRYFSIFNHEEEQDYLIEQHQKGWKFIKVSGLGIYHFEQCQPEHVIYQLDFNQEASREKQEYIRMFEDCGWEYLQEYAGFSYFRKNADQMNSDEEIFCDENSRLQMLERVYKGRLVPLLIIFSACVLPQFILNLSNGNYVLVVIYGFIIGVYATLFGYSAYHYYRKKNRVE